MGAPAAGVWGYLSPFGLVLVAVVGLRSFMTPGPLDDMTMGDSLPGSSLDSCCQRASQGGKLRICPTKGGGDIVHTCVHSARSIPT